MYFDKKRNRVLLRDGTSIVSSSEYVNRIINQKKLDGVFVIPDKNTKKYEMYNGEKISKDIEDIELDFRQENDSDINELLDIIQVQKRFENIDTIRIERLYKELDFFQRTGNIRFILECKKLIEKFKENGEVWGVGRGSSCASYLMFILEIHDVDSVKYNIPFSEFSKEEEDDE